MSTPWSPSARALRGARTWADAIELFILPCVAALLPHALGLAMLRVAVRWTAVYRVQAWLAATGHQNAGFGEPTRAWKDRLRFVRAVDHFDLYRALLRPRWWLLKDVRIFGQGWPVQRPPLLALTAHWGAGMFSIHALRAQGHRVHFLSAPIERERYGACTVGFLYARLRMWVTTRAGGEALIETGGAFDTLKRALESGHTVVALLDLPATNPAEALSADYLNRSLRVSRGLLRLADVTGTPTALYTVAVPTGLSPTRCLTVQSLKVGSRETVDAQVGFWIGDMLRQDPAAWHVWQHAPAYFEP